MLFFTRGYKIEKNESAAVAYSLRPFGISAVRASGRFR